MASTLLIILYSLGLLALLGIAAVGALLWARNLAQKHNRTLYKIRTPKGIDCLEPVEIGGLKQWFHIRGRNIDNPVLLLLHGGPGLPNIGCFDEIQRPWEEYFTVVQWDQRHVGKSHDRPLQKAAQTVTMEQLLNDTEEAISYIRGYLGKEKIFIMGYSLGTYLGMKMVSNRPEWFHSYIGVGQTTNSVERVREEHALLLADAKSKGNKALATKLEAMMPVPDPENKMRHSLTHGYYQWKEIFRSGLHEMSVEDWIALMRFGFLTSPHYTLSNLLHMPPSEYLVEGSKFCEEFMSLDLPAEVGPSFDVPIIFLTGAHDCHIPYTLTDAWFKEIQAPYKEQIWLQDTSHFPFVSEPGKVLVALVTKVLPLAKENF